MFPSHAETLLQDLRFAVRQLRRNPLFAILAIVILGIGIGANTAIFSFVNSVLLRPLPYPDADRLTIILSDLGNSSRAPASMFELYQMRQRSREFDQIAGIWVTNRVLPGEGDAEQGKLGVVSSNFLPLFCVRPALGRFFAPEDDQENAPSTTILSHELWVRKFGSDPHIVGKLVPVGRESSTVVGVLPANFRLLFPEDASVPPKVDYFQSMPIGPWQPNGPGFLHTVGRLRRADRLAAAQAELATIAEQINQIGERDKVPNYHLYAFPLQEDDVRNVRPTLYLLFGAVAFLLLISCANVANLLMVRSRYRLREVSIRAALGASTPRLIRQVITETVLLVLLGGLLAVLLGAAFIKAIVALEPASFAHLAPLTLDLRALTFTFCLALTISLLIGVAPISLVRHVEIAEQLKRGGRLAAYKRRGFATLLVAGEVSLAFVLLLGAGLLVRTFVNILRIDPGFRPEDVFTLRVNVGDANTLREVLRAVADVPGVRSASAVSHLPLDDAGNWYDTYWKEGTPPEQQNTRMADMRSIMPGYFQAVGAQLVQGRDFTHADDSRHQHVGVIDEKLAQELWPGESPLGKRINISDSPKGFYQFERDWLVVVGVIRPVQNHGLVLGPQPQVYVPYPLAPRPAMSIVMLTNGPVPGLPAMVRQQIAKLNLHVPVTSVEPLATVVDHARAASRFIAFLAILLAFLGVQLAMGGLYGVLSYSMYLRTAEIGLRMAVGAQRREIVALVFREGLVPVIAGVSGGALLSALSMHMVDHLLFGTSSGNPAMYGLMVTVILLLSVISMLLPALRATQVDPVTAIRTE